MRCTGRRIKLIRSEWRTQWESFSRIKRQFLVELSIGGTTTEEEIRLDLVRVLSRAFIGVDRKTATQLFAILSMDMGFHVATTLIN